jgi:5-methylthioadenosine/S-adenosylhomocysteine deaminase
MARTLLQGATILTADDERPLIEDGHVVVDGGAIAAVGPGRPDSPAGVDEVLDCRGHLLTPGFVNAHTHLCMVLGRNLGGDRSLLHTAETPEYNELVQQRTGRSNVGMLADVGALGSRVMLNHCVHLSEEDVGLIAESGSPVIHDPTSNMLLASGVAPVPRLLEAGITVGLACDGPACNNGQDMIEAMKAAALLQKVTTRRADALVARDVFRMATRGGAAAIGLGDRLGAIREGFRADLVLIDLQAPHLTPLNDPLTALVFAARGSDVRTVLVDGEVVVRDRQVTTLDEAAVRARAAERARRARGEAGV